MNKVTSYLKNVGKSTAYAAADVTSNLIPNTKDFIETNENLLKSTYAVLSHSKQSINRGKKFLKDSQIYKDIDAGIKDTLSDIKTGNFYNKERSQMMHDKAADFLISGGDDDFGDDFDDFDFDDFDDSSLDDFEDKPSKKENITQGDIVIADSVAKSTNLSSQLISSTVAKTSKAIMNTTAAATNAILSQNMQLTASIRTNIAGVHESINGILKFAVDVIKPQYDIQAEYFTKTQQLMVENNAILKEMLEMQRNLYKKETSPSKEDDYSKIFSGSSLDIQEYFKLIGKNIKKLDNTGSIDMMTSNMGDGTMISQMFANPLGGIMTGLIASFMPRSLAKSIMTFDKTLAGIFPSLIARMNKWKKDDFGIKGILGKIFGADINTKEKIDTSKYNKGAVPFDGITRKAIVDVIPEHLSRIESLLTGQSQRLYDYNSGKWTNATEIKKKIKQDEENAINSVLGSTFTKYMENFVDEMKKQGTLTAKLLRDINNDYRTLKENAISDGYFSPEQVISDIKNMGVFFNNPEIMQAMLEGSVKDKFGKTAMLAESQRSIADYKQSKTNRLKKEEENGDSIRRKLYDNSNLDSHLKFHKKYTDISLGLNPETVIGLINKGIIDPENPPKGVQIPKIIQDAIDKRDRHEKELDEYFDKKYNTNDDIPPELAAEYAKFKAANSIEIIDKDDLAKYGKRIDKNNKYAEAWNNTEGTGLFSKMKNTKSIGGKYKLMRAKIDQLVKRPSDILNNLIHKADTAIYNMLFTVDTDEEDGEGKKIKGVFNAMVEKMRISWETLTNTLTEKIIDPLSEKLKIKEKWENLKNRANNTTIAQKLRNLKGALKSNIKGAGRYVINSVEDVLAENDSTIADFIINRNNVSINKYQNNLNKKIAENAKDVKATVTSGNETVAVVGGETDPNKIKENKKKEQEVADELKKSGIDDVETKAEGGFHFPEEDKINNLKKRNEHLEEIKSDKSPIQMVYEAAKEEGKKLADAAFGLVGSDDEKKAKIEQQKKSIGATLGKVFGEIKGEGYDIAAKGILGGGLGLLTGLAGGPIIGAAIGAGAAILKNSETVSKLILGEEIDNNGQKEYKKGLIPKKIQDTFKKYVPTMTKYGTVGAVSSLILPFGPLAGAAIGAGIGFIKKSDEMNEMLFGDENGLFNKDRKEAIKKALPNVTAGVVGGLFLGPFGMMGNAALGAGVGLLSTSEEFQTLLFGEKGENGERFGGLKGTLNDKLVQPLKEFGENFKDNFFDMLKTNMIDPLNESITPVTRELSYWTKKIVFGIPKFFINLFEDKVGIPLITTINDRFIDPILGATTGLLKKTSQFAQKIIFAPFAGIRKFGNFSRSNQIKRGDATYMGAEEQLQFMKQRGVDNFKTKSQLESMAGMSDDQISQALTAVRGSVDGLDFIDKEIKSNNRALSNKLIKNFKSKQAKKIARAINKGDRAKAIELLDELKMRKGITADEYSTYLNEINKLTNKNEKLRMQKDSLNQFLNGDGELDDEGIISFLNDNGFNIKNKNDLKKLKNQLKGENAYRKKKKGDLTAKEMRESLSSDGEAITNVLQKIEKLISDIKSSVEAGGTGGISTSNLNKLNKDDTKTEKIIQGIDNRRKANRLKRIATLKALGVEASVLEDEKVASLIDKNNDVYNIVLGAAKNKVFLTKKKILFLEKLSNKQKKELLKNPSLASLDEKSIRRYLGDNVFTNYSTRRNKSALKAGLEDGLDLSSIDKVTDFLNSSKDKKGYQARIDYINKFREKGLLGKYGLTEYYIYNANYRDLDMILKNPADYIKRKTKDQAEEIDKDTENESAVTGLTTTVKNGAKSFKNKIHTIFTQWGPMSYIEDSRGNYEEAKTSQNRETEANRLKDQNSNKDILNSLTSIKDGIFGIFKHNKDKDEEENKEPWYKKLFNFDLSGITQKLKFGGAILAAVTGIGALKNLWDNRESGGVLDTIGTKVGDAVNPVISNIGNWFTNSGDYADENKGFSGFLNKHVFPNMFSGINVIFRYVMPAIIKAFIVNIPTMFKAAMAGVSELFGWTNKHKNDNKLSAKNIKGIDKNSSIPGLNISAALKGVDTDAMKTADIIQKVADESTSGYDVDYSSDTASTGTSSNSKSSSSKESGLSKVVNSLLGNKNNDANINNDDIATIENIVMYKKDKNGNLIPITMDEVKNGPVSDFYTEVGAHYIYNPKTGDYEGDSKEGTRERGLPERLSSVAIRSFAAGKPMGILRIGKSLSNSFVGKAGGKLMGLVPGNKILKYGAKGVGTVSNAAASLGKKARESLTKKAAKSATTSTALDTIKQLGYNVGDNIIDADFTEVRNVSKAPTSTALATIDNITPKSTALDTIKNMASNVGDNIIDAEFTEIDDVAAKVTKRTKGKFSSILDNVIEFIHDGLTKIFGNDWTLKKISDAAGKAKNFSPKKLASEAVEKLTKAFRKLLEKIPDKVVKIAGKAAVVLNVFFIGRDLMKGWNQSDAILGVKNTSLVEKLLSTIINVVNNQLLFGLIDTEDVVSLFIDVVLPLFNVDTTDIQQRRAEVTAEVEQYNALHQTNYNEHDYLAKDTWTYKVEQFAGNTWNNVKGGVSSGVNFVKDKASQFGTWAGEKAKGVKDWFGNTKEAAGKALNAVGENISEKIDMGKELYDYAKQVVGRIFKEAIYDEPVDIDPVKEDDPLRGAKKAIYETAGIALFIPSQVAKLGVSVYDELKTITNGLIGIGKEVGGVVKGVFSKAWNGDIVGAFTDTKKLNTGNEFIDNLGTAVQYVARVPIAVPTLVTAATGFVVRHFTEIVDGVKAIGSGTGTTVSNLFKHAWNGEILEVITDTSGDADTGNGFVDTTSKIINDTTKFALIMPGLLTAGAGAVARTIGNVIKSVIPVKDNAVKMVSDVTTTAISGNNPLSIILSNSHDTKTGNGFTDTVSKMINTAIKFPLTPVALLTAGASAAANKLKEVFNTLKNITTLSKKDKAILDNAKKAKTTPFNSAYWTVNNSYSGVAGFLYTFNSYLQKVLNIPSALLAMINPANWLDGVKNKINEWVGNDDDEFTTGKSNKKKKKSGSGSGKTGKNPGFISQLDSKYRNKSFNTSRDTESQTLGDSGCGPATAANILNLYAGKGNTMDEASEVALKYKDKNGGVRPEYFEDYLSSKGIQTASTMNKNEMMQNISAGRPTVLLGADPTNRANTPYGARSSHYVLATGMDGKGNMIIQDPESRKPNALYPAKDVIKQSTVGMVTGLGTKAKNIKYAIKSKLGPLGSGRGRSAESVKNQDLATWAPITAEELNEFMRQNVGADRAFQGKGQIFIEAGKASGLDPRYILAHGATETGWGSFGYASSHNYFGIGVFNSNPDNGLKYANRNMREGIINGAKWIRANYYDQGQKTVTQFVTGRKKYAVYDDGSPNFGWVETISSIIARMPSKGKAVYHKAADLDIKEYSEGGYDSSDDSESSESTSSSNSIFDKISEAAKSYFDPKLTELIFGSDSSSSSEDDSYSDDSDSGDGDSGGDDSALPPGASGNAKEFFNKYNGKRVDVDGWYGAQCVDLFSKYKIDYVDGKPSTGNAINLYDNYGNGSDGFTRVPLSKGKFGDWIIWGGGPETDPSYGHVGMLIKREGNGRVQVFGQNQGPGANLTTGKAGSVNSVTEGGIRGLLRQTNGKGSGKLNKITKYLDEVSHPKFMKVPGLKNKEIAFSVEPPTTYTTLGTKYGASMEDILPSGKGTALPLLKTSTPTLNTSSTMMTSSSNVSTNGVEKLINVIIEILTSIADNTSKLSDIVNLLSKSLGLELTNNDISTLSSNNAQIKNKIANALRTQGSANGVGNSVMNASTEALASALYSIASA